MAADQYNLDRFVSAQADSYSTALAEIKNGRKRNHWMWYIFPQIKGLGFSETSKYYAIQNLAEAAAYLQHPILGPRLIQISNALLTLPGNNATQIFGNPDDMKLHSSMTLFATVENTTPVFAAVLDKFFGGEKDRGTLEMIQEYSC